MKIQSKDKEKLKRRLVIISRVLKTKIDYREIKKNNGFYSIELGNTEKLPPPLKRELI